MIAMRRVLVASLLVALNSQFVHADDVLEKSLGLTRETGSLPLWEKPDLRAQAGLTNSALELSKAVVIVGSPGSGFGTGFVVSREHRLVVTNAHVADIATGDELLVKPNGTTQTFNVARRFYHPKVHRQFAGAAEMIVKSEDPTNGPVHPRSPDVAVLQLEESDEELPAEVTLADAGEVDALFAKPVGIMGYPGHDTESFPVGEPSATYRTGVISRLSDFFGNTDIGDKKPQFVQHTMSTWGGYSGSPIFLPNGHVVAVHNMSRYARRGGHTKAIPHGVRVDCLWELLVYHDLDELKSVPVSYSDEEIAEWSQEDPDLMAFSEGIRLFNLARHQVFDLGKLADGARTCKEAVKLIPNYARLYYVRGSAFGNYAGKDNISAATRDKYLDLSMKDKKKAIQLDPTDPWGPLGIGSDMVTIGFYHKDPSKYDTAISIADHVLSVDGLEPLAIAQAYTIKATATRNQGHNREAIRHITRAIEAAPSEYRYKTRAYLWGRLGNRTRQRADQQQADEMRRQGKRF